MLQSKFVHPALFVQGGVVFEGKMVAAAFAAGTTSSPHDQHGVVEEEAEIKMECGHEAEISSPLCSTVHE